MSKINHNNHIQSLRGIAIISVILFHTNPEFFSTGYLGVDIFFVISGYLICKVLAKNKELNKNLLADFYIKRARRTLPALLVLMFISIPFFIYILMPVNLIDYGQSLIATSIFLSNFLFGSENTYWGALSELKPLLHTWSLSIEWQFYLLFPLLFFFKKKLPFFIIFFLLSIVSNFFINFAELPIFINDHKIRTDNFFFTTNRIWEFLAGSCLYLFEKNKKFRIKKNNFLLFLGLFLIFFSFYFFDRFAREKIYFNLLPVMGSCLFIYYGNVRNNFDKIYKNKFLLHIGLISYSLYLWHQPILAYFKNLFNNNIPSLYYYLIYFLIYIFSVASFYLIEKSFYEKQILRNKKFTLFIFLSTLIIIFTGFLIASGKVNIENSINKQVSDIQKKFPNLDIKDIAQKRGFQNHEFFNKKFSNTGKIKIYISGDSHSKDLFLILQSSEKITKFYEFSLDNIDEADAILYTRQFYEEMLKDFEKHDIFIKTKGKNKKIIIIGRAAEFYTGNIDPLIFNLIQDPNNLNAYKNNNKEFIDKNFYNILRDDVIKINKQLKIKAEEMGALYIDRVDLGCDIIKQTCHSMTPDGYPIYWDHSHLTWQGVNFFSNLVDKKNWFGPVEMFLKKNK
jgi:peptidoglycan/LPS O-acetylase OafA/YrhL